MDSCASDQNRAETYPEAKARLMLESGLTEERLQEAFTRYFEYRIGKTDVGWSRDRVEKELGMSWNHFCCLRNLHNHLNNIVTDEFWYIDRDK